ncbi:MAG TPA: IS66 family transposase [Candidatus Nitrosotenuis sp.]|nr:IS66 family transposase [Candidatus Nitrosotenuis sp.]
MVPARVIVTRYRIIPRYCRNYRTQVSAPVHDVLPSQRFGLRLMVLAISLKMLGLSYQKISELFRMLLCLDVTESAVKHAVFKVACAFGPRYLHMIDELKSEKNMHGDQTSWRINGKNHWLWAFVGRWTAVYEVDRSRRSCVPQKVLRDYDGNVTSDSWSAWNGVGKTHQRCHIYYTRELGDTIQYKNPGPEFVAFARMLKRILHDSHTAASLGRTKRLHAKENLAKRANRLITKKCSDSHCIRLVKRLKREKDMLFTFLDTKTEWHNNAAERQIRPNVIIRKITNGHRTESGAVSHKILMSIKETSRLRGQFL